jgi:hypothetical protein
MSAEFDRLVERADLMRYEALAAGRRPSRWRLSRDLWDQALGLATLNGRWSKRTVRLDADGGRTRGGVLLGIEAEIDETLPPNSLILE